jgi:bifunctional DNase/RNase
LHHVQVRVTDIIANTYYARVHVARAGGEGEVDVDARPSDAINLAVRFGAPVYIAKKIAGALVFCLWF